MTGQGASPPASDLPCAHAGSFRILPPPVARADLPLDERYDAEEAELIHRGLVPQGSDDRWFFYCADGWLHIHRSWTGAQIFALRLTSLPDGTTLLSGGWVSRERAQYAGDDLLEDAQLVRDLIASDLLNRN